MSWPYNRAMNALIRYFPTVDYSPCWQAMRALTDHRGGDTEDELWVLEHPPVFTLGQAGKPEHVLNPGDIPVVNSDRGGQVTYHGPGQTVIYLMLDIKRIGLGSRGLVTAIEDSIIEFLNDQGINAASRDDAPGVYVNGAKIASLGLRIRRGANDFGGVFFKDGGQSVDVVPVVVGQEYMAELPIAGSELCQNWAGFGRIHKCGGPGCVIMHQKCVVI